LITNASTPLVPRLEIQEYEPVRHLTGPAESQPRSGEEPAPLRQGQQDRLDLLHVTVRIGQRRSLGGDHDPEGDAPVLGGHELAPQEEERRARDRDQDRRRADDTDSVPECLAQQPIVGPVQPREGGVERPRGPGVAAPVEGPQHSRREHRGQGERDEAGDQHRDRERDSELVEEPPDRPLKEGDRNEDRDERDGGGEDGEADLVRAVQRRLPARLPHLEVPVDVLEHHDRVVHDQPDGENER
jgi:hypothetical protein